MTPLALKGAVPASLCPFREDLSLDEAALVRHVAWLCAASESGGVVCNGHAGEVASLSRQERRRVVELAVEAAAGKAPVVAGVYADNTADAVLYASDAEAAGADALLVFTPPIFGAGANRTAARPLAFIEAIAGAVDIGLVLFQFSTPGPGFSTDVLARLIDIPSVVAVKEGSDHLPAFERNLRMIKARRPEVAVLTTNNTMLFATAALGADGILSGSGSVVADLHHALHAALHDGDLGAARRINDRLWPLTEALYCDPLIDMHNRMKFVLAHLGRLPNAVVRPPLLPLSGEERGRLVEAVAAAGLT